MVKNLKTYLWCAFLAVLLVLLLREAWVVAVEHVLVPDWKSFKWSRLSWPNVFKHFNLGLYWWFMVGIALYYLIREILVRRSEYYKGVFNGIETLSHEFSHSLAGFLMGRRIHSMHVEERQGNVVTSGPAWSRPFVSLAPYTLPFITYIGLAFRTLIAWKTTWLFDIIIGATMGFHLGCFTRQTGTYQPDINRFSTLWFPFLYIAVWTVFNFNVIAVSFWGSKNFFTAIWWVIQHLVVW